MRIRSSNPPYECIRCNYETSHKPDMKRHLYASKKVCPSVRNQIELTDEIKEEILNNRRYRIPHVKKEKKEIKASITEKFAEISMNNNLDVDKGSIYIMYTRACKNGDEGVYKIGKTGDYIKRQSQYTKGGEMIFVANVNNRHESENLLKAGFCKEFKQRRDYGTEYYEGDIFEMVLLLKDILVLQIEKIIIDFNL